MKQALCLILALLVMVPVLCFSAGAAVLNMNDVVNSELLPPGYVFPGYLPIVGSNPELVFFDYSTGLYLHITFAANNPVTFVRYGNYYLMRFTRSDFLSVRGYECNGRQIFNLVEGQEINITIPGQTIFTSMNGVYLDFNAGDVSIVYPDEKNFADYFTVFYSGGQISKITSNVTDSSGNRHTAYANFDKLGANLKGSIMTTINESGLSLLFDDFSIKSFDYYRIRSAADTIETSVDYSKTYSVGNAWQAQNVFLMNGVAVYGYPIAISNMAGGKPFLYENASYSVNTLQQSIVLVNSQNMASFPKVPLSLFNRFLNHFGYQPLTFSEAGFEASQDMQGLQQGMQGYFDKTASFGTTATAGVNNIKANMTQVAVISGRVWSAMPSWFWSLLVFAMIMLVARKGIGR